MDKPAGNAGLIAQPEMGPPVDITVTAAIGEFLEKT
jgi:hypothetical protein